MKNDFMIIFYILINFLFYQKYDMDNDEIGLDISSSIRRIHEDISRYICIICLTWQGFD